MLRFREWLNEEKHHPAIVTSFGKFRIVTVSHKEGLHQLHAKAQELGADSNVTLSGTSNAMSKEERHAAVRYAAPKDMNVETSGDHNNTMVKHLQDLHRRGYKTVYLGGGSDREKDVKRMSELNGTKDRNGEEVFNFPGGIHHVPIGDGKREDPKPGEKPGDMTEERRRATNSATEAQRHVEDNDFESFKHRWGGPHPRKYFNIIRRRLRKDK